MKPTIASLMRRQIEVVSMDHSVAQVEALFAQHRLSWAPVVDPDGEIVGVISSRDLVRARTDDPVAAAGSLPVWRLCTYKPITVEAGTPLDEVARQMVERNIHHVVVTEQGRVSGVVSALDFVGRFV